MEMGILGTSSNYQNCMKSTNNKIPEYARDYKKEYLYIRGLNKEFKYFYNHLDEINNGLFKSKRSDRLCNLIKRFLRGQEKDKLKDISEFEIYEDDVDYLIKIKREFSYYKIRYDALKENDDSNDPYPGFENIYYYFELFFNKLNIEYEDSLRSRRLEVAGERENGRARGRHARGEGAPARKAPENRFNSHSVSADISNWSRGSRGKN